MLNLISVIIPVYNVEKFVEQAILSICYQTYTNLEIIIIDDCSTDNTFALVQRIAQEDERIKLYRNEKNLKLVNTLNKALQFVTGEYVLRMDGDDISALDRIEKMYDFLQKNPDYVLVGSQVNTIDEQGNQIGQPNLPNNLEVIQKVCSYISPILHIWLCKTSIYTELDGYRNILGAEDYDFILRTLSRGYKIKNLDDRLYSVRIRQGNTISTIGFKQLISHQYCVQLYKERLKNHNQDSFNDNYLLGLYDLEMVEQDKFTYDYANFKKGFLMLKSKKVLGVYYVALAYICSPYIRSYLNDRIMYRLKMLG